MAFGSPQLDLLRGLAQTSPIAVPLNVTGTMLVYRVGMTGNCVPHLPEYDKMADMSEPFFIVLSQFRYKFRGTFCFHISFVLVK